MQHAWAVQALQPRNTALRLDERKVGDSVDLNLPPLVGVPEQISAIESPTIIVKNAIEEEVA